MDREIGDYIRIVRKFRKMTQEQLAKAIGVNRSLISKYEKNMIEPSVKQLKKISETLGVDILDIESEAWDLEDDEILMLLNGELTLDESKTMWIHSDNSDPANKLLGYFNMLNEIGQRELVDYAEGLTYVPKYKKRDPASDEEVG